MISDVATLAGVSYATVTRVVAGHPNVRADTRAKVWAAIDMLNWTPDPAAQALGGRRAKRGGSRTGTG